MIRQKKSIRAKGKRSFRERQVLKDFTYTYKSALFPHAHVICMRVFVSMRWLHAAHLHDCAQVSLYSTLA